MQRTLIGVPAPSPTDSETVKTALEVAAAWWERGDSVAAIRWLRRAAEAADVGGDIARMAALARAAAELDQASPADSEPRAKTPTPPSSIPPPPASGRTLKPMSLPRSSAPSPKPPSPPPSHRPPVPPPERVRVSVRTSVRDPMLLVVRPLAEGQRLPEGAREAFLVMADGEPLALPASKRSAG
jgi:hypothetical protein